MKQYNGNFLSYLNSKTKAATDKSNATKSYTVKNIDVHDIIPNEKNFYSITNVEQLAARMALSGHISPLEVLPGSEPGKYTLLSGERRRAAVLYRLEKGEITDPTVPCIVREDMRSNDRFTAEEVEIINLITANDYRTKTPFEQLEEVLRLKPIAKRMWEEQNQEGEQQDKDTPFFRDFFAKQLGLSDSALQRILVLQKLVPEAKAAYEAQQLPKSALAVLAGKSEDVQREYLKALSEDLVGNTIADVKAADKRPWLNQDEQSADETNIEDSEQDMEDVSAPNAGPLTDKPVLKPEEQSPVSDGSKDDESAGGHAAGNSVKPDGENSGITMDQARAQADEWVMQEIMNIIDKAEKNMKLAKDNDNGAEAAMWDLRRAAATVVFESMK